MYRRRVATIPGERLNVADVPAGVLGRRDAAVELRDEIVEIGARPGLRRVVCSKEQEHRGVIHGPTLELGSSQVSAVALLERSRRPVADLAANQPDDAAEVPLRRREGGPLPSDQRYVLRERAEVPLAGVGEQNPRRLIIISSVERYGQTTESLKCMGLSALECGRSVYLEYAGAFGIEESEDAVPPGCCHAQREFLEPSALGKALGNALHVHVPPPLHAWRWHS